ncbi:MAG: DUF4097 domain-containing protein [Lachnospiraceae bacterium]|nr:DUF4097 domain-containing protein [Lachnospiraceae bacterium]
MGGGNASLRHTTNLSIDEKTALDITVSSDNIYFLQSDSNELIVKEYYGNSARKADIRQSGQTVTIRSEQHINLFSFGFGMISDRIEIYLPKNYAGNINAKASSGNIKSELVFVGDRLSFEANSGTINLNSLTAGKVNLRASSGSIKINEINGNSTVKANSGSITIDRIGGLADIDASSGTIRVDNISGGINAKANSGAIRIGITELKGDVSATTSSGSINLDLPSDSSFRFSADTSSGSIRTDFEGSLSFNSRGNSANGVVGSEPVYTVALKANSGGVRVSR